MVVVIPCTGFDNEDDVVHKEDGVGTYTQGVGSQPGGYLDALDFDSKSLVSETPYSQAQHQFVSPNRSMQGFRPMGPFSSRLDTNGFSGHQTCM